MPEPKVVEVSFVFRGKDASKNVEAFMSYLDTVEGLYGLIKGIRQFGGTLTHISNDPEQKLVILDGDMGDE